MEAPSAGAQTSTAFFEASKRLRAILATVKELPTRLADRGFQHHYIHFQLVREIYDSVISAVTLATGHNDPFVPSFPAKIRFRAPETPPFCHPCYRIIGWMNSEHLANERVPVQLSDCSTSWQPCIYSIAQCSNCLEHLRTTISLRRQQGHISRRPLRLSVTAEATAYSNAGRIGHLGCRPNACLHL